MRKRGGRVLLDAKPSSSYSNPFYQYRESPASSGIAVRSSHSSGSVPVLKETVERLVDEIELSKMKEAVLEEKLNALETRLDEESLAKALLLARIPSLFSKERAGPEGHGLVAVDEQPLATKGDVAGTTFT